MSTKEKGPLLLVTLQRPSPGANRLSLVIERLLYYKVIPAALAL
jgi:hypothetical protein